MGAPAAPRLKSYSAQTGYAYQYYYMGCRPLHGRGVTEFVFHVSADRSTWMPAAVLLGDVECVTWQNAHARTLSETERYAIAKMALFQAFDERARPASMRERIRVRAADLAAIAEKLDFG